jgi:hypothetical protein
MLTKGLTTVALLAATMHLGACLARAQTLPPNSTSSQQTGWKEYVYANDGFAATFPVAPNAHKDSQVRDGTAYTLSFKDAQITLHVVNYPNGCGEAFAQYVGMVRKTMQQLREGTLDQSQSGFRGDPASVKEFALGGFPAIEHEQEVLQSGEKDYERWNCVQKRLYIFTAAWPRQRPKPMDVIRIVDSFRLLPR